MMTFKLSPAIQIQRIISNLKLKKSYALILITIFILSGCTWNASIKSLDDNTAAISECGEEAPITASCKVSILGKIVTSRIGTSVISWSNPTLSNTVTANIPDGYYSSQMCYLQDIDLIPANIKFGVNIFGIEGSFVGGGTFQTNMASSALRDSGVQVISNLTDQMTSNQITLDNEQNTYSGTDLPATGGFNYRDIPDVTKDDEGHDGVTCKYAPRPTNDCGTTQNTVSARIADCLSLNTLTSIWNGSVQCNRGQGIWKLVTRMGANKEVWQDQRTGQLWSSRVRSSMNWCQASGNTQLAPVTFSKSYNNTVGSFIIGNGTIGSLNGGYSSVNETITIAFTSAMTFTVSGSCGAGAIVSGGLTAVAGSTVTWSRANFCSFTITQGSVNFAVNDKFILNSVSEINSCSPGAGSGLQPASPISYCAEASGVGNPPGEDWTNGIYMSAKGGMGKTITPQSPSIRWRLPSIEDYMLANVNGIRFVMPDMGIVGTSRPVIDGSPGGSWEWSSTLVSNNRTSAWYFTSGFVSNDFRTSLGAVRCVGR